MGFAPERARAALAATETGCDVQAALEALLASDAAEEGRRPRAADRARNRPGEGAEPPRRRAPAPREVSAPVLAQEQRTPQLQEQADKLLAQASELGFSVFSRANAFWTQGRERVQRVYEERARTGQGSGEGEENARGQRAVGRPKWMQEGAVHVDEGGEDVESLRPRPEGRVRDEQPASLVKGRAKAEAKTGDLLSDGAAPEPAAYVSPFRRRRPPPASANASTSSPATPPQPRAPSPIRRPVITASPSELAASAAHKAAGAEKFRLGQYAEAASAYTAALDALPSGHLLCVPLLNNRALARLRTGDHAGAGADADAVVALVGPGYHPRREPPDAGSGVDLAGALLKAWRRRAEACEARERWAPAQRDWECVAGADWADARVRAEGVRGAGRCRRMAAGGVNGVAVAAARPRAPAVRPRPRRGNSPPSVALTKLRGVQDAAEAEDQARHELKDVVDTRLRAWKGGKETNLRALLASLDAVLWPELGWVRVGMGELVSVGQVKVRYMRAIAKVHPDKVSLYLSS